jgi:dimethylargininase
MKQPHALVRNPSPILDAGELTHQIRTAVDFGLARDQHGTYVELIRSAGYTVVYAPALDDYPDGVFVEDTMSVIGTAYVLTQPRASSRADEVASVAGALTSLGIQPVGLNSPEVTLDGGDVLVTERHLFVGMSTRTNRAAITRLAPIARRQGRDAFGMPVQRCLHLKTGVTNLPDGGLIHNDFIDGTPFIELGYRTIYTPEANGANVLVLGQTVVVSAEAVETARLLSSEGYEVQTADISEFHKLEAGLTCLSVLFEF